MQPARPDRDAAAPASDEDIFPAAANWSEARPFAGTFLGIVAGLNAVAELNPAAALAWEAVRLSRSLSEAEALYAELSPVRRDTARADLCACVARWREAGLLAVARPGPVAGAAPDPEGRAWAFDRTLSVAGRTIGVRIEDPALAAECAWALMDFPPAAAPPDERICVLAPSAEGWWATSLRHGARLSPDGLGAKGALYNLIVTAGAPDEGWLAILHGACVEGERGAILFSAAGGSGKTTLAVELAFRGWRVLGEDTVPLNRRIEAVPLPFAPSVKEGAWDILGRRSAALLDCPVFRSGERRLRYLSLAASQRAVAPTRPDLVIFPRYDPAAAGSARPVPPAERLRRLLTEESWVDFEQDGGEAFLSWVERVPAFEISYATSEVAEAVIAELIGGIEFTHH